MYKTISVYDLPPGTDDDKFWEYHTKVHAPDVVKASQGLLKKFVLNRVTEVVAGDIKAFGIIEMWWESKEAAAKYRDISQNYKTASGKSPIDDFLSRGVINRFRIQVDEKVIL